MTDTTDVLPGMQTAAQQDVPAQPNGTPGGTTATRTPAGSEGAGTRPRRRATSTGLAALVLPELQALAGELGITGTGRLRKSQLIEAIQERQNGAAVADGGLAANGHALAERPAARGTQARQATSRSGPPRSAVPTSATTGEANAGSAPADGDAAGGRVSGSSTADTSSADSETAGRSTAGSDSTAGGDVMGSDTAPSPAADASDTAAESGAGPDAESAGSERSERPERIDRGRERFLEREARRHERQQQREARAADAGAEPADQDGESASQQPDRAKGQGGQQAQANQVGQEAPGNQQAPGGQQAPGDQQAPAGQGGTDRQARQGGGQPRQDEGPRREDEDDSRRGRFRERGRNRRGRAERFTPNEAEPVVNPDDVLLPIGGILDISDSYGFVRTSGYLTGPNDVYVSLQQVRRYGLRRGDAVTGAVKQPRDGERKDKYNALVRLDSVNGMDPEEAKKRPEFTKLTPLYPQDRLRLETEGNVLTTRVIDLVMPVGKGQRALIVSPPKAGKTMVMQAIANAIAVNNPECHLMVVLVDERPEEVTDMQRSVKGEVIASTFDRPPQDHITVAELSIERAKRLVEMGHDVVVLLDSITRLGRAYNLGAPASGRILTGGVDSAALYPPKRFLGAARNIENGGSLTIFATALVETGSAMDTVIFEEFKGTGNAELKLDRSLANKRIFPAIDVDASSTRKEELLLAPDELRIVLSLRRVLHALDSAGSLELLLDRMKSTRTNIEFLLQVQKTTASQQALEDSK